MFQTSVLASGSKGNSILVRTNTSKILLDAGLSGKKITNFIKSIKLDENKLDAVVVSHEHSDHIRGAGIISRRFNIPMYISKATYEKSRKKLGKLPAGIINFSNGDTFEIGDIIIRAFPSSHDVIDGSNFTFQKMGEEGRKLAVATDLGYSSKLMLMRIMESTTIILESNHDVEMLLSGSYPPHLKQRIKSKKGHLSNKQAVEVVSKIIHKGLKNIILAHLSEENNIPQKAENAMRDYLQHIDQEIDLIVASQYSSTRLVDI